MASTRCKPREQAIAQALACLPGVSRLQHELLAALRDRDPAGFALLCEQGDAERWAEWNAQQVLRRAVEMVRAMDPPPPEPELAMALLMAQELCASQALGWLFHERRCTRH